MIRNAIRRPFHSLEASAPEIAPLSLNKSLIRHESFRLLRSCKDPKLILQIHARLLVSGLTHENLTATQLVNCYSSFGNSESARLIFNKAENPSVILWNSMIRAYTRTNHNREALELYRRMLERGVEVDKYTFTFVLKACTGALDLKEGVSVHSEISRRGLESDMFIGTGLIDMYCKLGETETARGVFDEMLVLDVVAWNAMIAGLSQGLEPCAALELFRRMQLSGIEPNSVTLLNIFPAISQLSAATRFCKSLHGFVVRRAQLPSAVSNGLIDMYSKCGNVNDAQRVFDQMLGQDDVSWGTMMAGYTHNGCFLEALELFDYLKGGNLNLNQVSAVSALIAAAEIRDLEKGREIHDDMVRRGTDLDVLVVTPLMTFYAKCGELGKAKQIFDGISERDVVAWSALIAAFVQSGHFEEGLSLFREMQNGDLKPNRVTIISLLPACADLRALNLGKSIHCYMIRYNIGLDVSTGTALVAMYVKCGSFSWAHILFNRMEHKDVVTWNALINGYAQIGDANNAMEMFHHLRLGGHRPDSGTMVGVLPACVLMNVVDEGICIHGLIIKSGFEADLHVTNALIDMYAKCGDLIAAEFLFNKSGLTKDEISWNVMITGYMQNGCAKEAISAFCQMRSDNIQPNLVTILSVLPAAAYLAALRDGMAVHAYVIQTGFESNVLVCNSLIDMYAKCGRLDISEEFFNRMPNRDTVSWNVMLAGYALNGLGHQAIELFSQMVGSCIEVDSVSFVNVLSACRHGGLVEEGRNVFHSMRSKHLLEPQLEHYACMVDLLGRAGRLEEAWDLIQRMPMAPDAGVWGAFLGACRMHSNVKLGEVALDNLIRLEPQNPAHHVVLSNIYAQSGRWGDVGKMRTNMNLMGLKKIPGCSWVEIKKKVHAFKAGDQTHPQFEKMSILWDGLLEKMGKMGYIPDTICVLYDVEEEEKESFLYSHSERLALVFALLNTEPGVPIQIVKNLRVCPDCHTAMKLISEITGRRIIARDANRFHHFESGSCSCKDYW